MQREKDAKQGAEPLAEKAGQEERRRLIEEELRESEEIKQQLAKEREEALRLKLAQEAEERRRAAEYKAGQVRVRGSGKAAAAAEEQPRMLERVEQLQEAKLREEQRLIDEQKAKVRGLRLEICWNADWSSPRSLEGGGCTQGSAQGAAPAGGAGPRPLQGGKATGAPAADGRAATGKGGASGRACPTGGGDASSLCQRAGGTQVARRGGPCQEA